MATTTFYEYQNSANICDANGVGTTSYTIDKDTGNIIKTQETSSIVFKDHIGNEFKITTSPFVRPGALGYGVQVKISVFMKHVSGEIYTQDIFYPRSRTGSNFVNLTASSTISWNFNSISTTYRKYDVTETSTIQRPLRTDYKQYETSNFSTMTLNFQFGTNSFTDRFNKTLSNDKNSYPEKIVDHRFNYYHSLAAEATKDVATVNVQLFDVKMNNILMEDSIIKKKEINDADGKTFLHKVNDSRTLWNGGSRVETQLVSKGGRLTADTDLTLYFDRNLKIFGKIFAFDDLYPDNLSVKIDGLPSDYIGETIASKGEITPQEYLFEKFSILSNLAGASKSFQRDTVPTGQISTAIDGESLDVNLDDTSYSRLPFRGLNFSAIELYHEKQTPVLEGVTYDVTGKQLGYIRDYRTKNRDGTFTYTYRNFNSYRYLELLVKTKSGSNSTGLVSIECPNDTKQYTIEASGVFSRVRIDLCAPSNKNSIVDIQDNPYPRLLITDSTFTTNTQQERINGDYYGVSRVFRILIDNTDIEIKFDPAASEYGVYLVRNIFTRSNFLAERLSPSNSIKKVFTDKIKSNVLTEYFGRRYWQVDVDGRNEEEWDWGYQSKIEIKRTIKDFTDSLLKYHSGWKIKNYIQKGDLLSRSWYLNSIDGYMSWLGGDGVTFTTPGKYIFGSKINDKFSDVVLWLNHDSSSESFTKDVIAQTVFDSINGDFVPYYDNPFENHLENNNKFVMNLAASVILRGRVHGIVLDKNSNNLKSGSEVKLEYLLNDQLTNRGTATSDDQGTFYTKLPFGLGLKEHNVTNLSLTLKQIIESAKQQRFAFKVRDVLKRQISAIENLLTKQLLVAFNKSNEDVSLLSLDTIDNPITNINQLLYLNDQAYKFTGSNAVLINSNQKSNSFNNSNSFVLAEKADNILIVANLNSNDNENWYPYTSTISKTDSKIFTITKFNSYSVSYQSPEIYNSYVDQGILKLRRTNLNLSSTINAPNSEVVNIVEKVSDDFHPIIVLPSNDVLVLYKLESDTKKIYGKVYNNKIISKEFLVISSADFSNQPNEIFSPSITLDFKQNLCKIVFFHQKSLIYADFEIKNLLNEAISSNVKFHYIVGNEKESDFKTGKVSYYSTESINISAQKAGIISSTRQNKSDEVIVFFVDDNSDVNSVVIKPRSSTSKVRKYNGN
jgi:hypothetical protein